MNITVTLVGVACFLFEKLFFCSAAAAACYIGFSETSVSDVSEPLLLLPRRSANRKPLLPPWRPIRIIISQFVRLVIIQLITVQTGGLPFISTARRKRFLSNPHSIRPIHLEMCVAVLPPAVMVFYLWSRGKGSVHVRYGELGLGVPVVKVHQEGVVDAVPLPLLLPQLYLPLTFAPEKKNVCFV